MTSQNSQSGPAESRLQVWARQFPGQLKAQPGKIAVLGVLALVLIILLVRVLLPAGPNAATASVELIPPQTTAAPGNDAPASVELHQGLQPGPIELSSLPSQPRYELPQRDIFAIDYSYFSRRSGSESDSVGDSGKIDPEQLKLAALRRRVAQFNLKSTMTGPEPAAFIDGQLLREGDTYNGFEIFRINNRHVLLKHSIYMFRLDMPRE